MPRPSRMNRDRKPNPQPNPLHKIARKTAPVSTSGDLVKKWKIQEFVRIRHLLGETFEHAKHVYYIFNDSDMQNQEKAHKKTQKAHTRTSSANSWKMDEHTSGLLEMGQKKTIQTPTPFQSTVTNHFWLSWTRGKIEKVVCADPSEIYLGKVKGKDEGPDKGPDK